MTSEKDVANAIRTAWLFKKHVSTLPRWGRVQHESAEMAEGSLPNVDAETKSLILRNILIALRCHTCERRLSDECNFMICVRGLMSGTIGR
ncbi:MAG: hypothetical protein ACUVT7_06240 [Thermoplasmata archaeon]